jgi:hypothetical protein
MSTFSVKQETFIQMSPPLATILDPTNKEESSVA